MQSSLKRIAKVAGVTVLSCALFVAVFFLISSRRFQIAWASAVYDRHEHYLDCYGLAFYPQVQKALAQHADVVKKLKSAGAEQVTANEIKCQGFVGGIQFVKGDILITYSSRSQRQAIEKIIGDNFFGIPYRGLEVKLND